MIGIDGSEGEEESLANDIKCKNVDFNKIIATFEEVTSLLQEEQTDDVIAKTYSLIDIDKTHGEDESLAIDLKCQKSAITDFTEQAIFIAYRAEGRGQFSED